MTYRDCHCGSKIRLGAWHCEAQLLAHDAGALGMSIGRVSEHLRAAYDEGLSARGRAGSRAASLAAPQAPGGPLEDIDSGWVVVAVAPETFVVIAVFVDEIEALRCARQLMGADCDRWESMPALGDPFTHRWAQPSGEGVRIYQAPFTGPTP